MSQSIARLHAVPETLPLQELAALIEHAWEAGPTARHLPIVHEAVDFVIEALDSGRLRVAERQGVGQWSVNQWIKQAVLLYFAVQR